MSEDFKKEETKLQDSRELNENELEDISGGSSTIKYVGTGSSRVDNIEEAATSSIEKSDGSDTPSCELVY